MDLSQSCLRTHSGPTPNPAGLPEIWLTTLSPCLMPTMPVSILQLCVLALLVHDTPSARQQKQISLCGSQTSLWTGLGCALRNHRPGETDR